MARKVITTQRISLMLRQAEVEITNGKLVPEACKQSGVTVSLGLMKRRSA